MEEIYVYDFLLETLGLANVNLKHEIKRAFLSLKVGERGTCLLVTGKIIFKAYIYFCIFPLQIDADEGRP